MPLVTITTRPGFRLVQDSAPLTTMASRSFIRKTYGRRIPELLVYRAEELGLMKGPAEAVQVTFQEFGADDINVPDVWFKFELTEAHDDATCEHMRDLLVGYLTGLFEVYHTSHPCMAIDIFWGPSHGMMWKNSQDTRW